MSNDARASKPSLSSSPAAAEDIVANDMQDYFDDMLEMAGADDDASSAGGVAISPASEKSSDTAAVTSTMARGSDAEAGLIPSSTGTAESTTSDNDAVVPDVWPDDDASDAGGANAMTPGAGMPDAQGAATAPSSAAMPTSSSALAPMAVPMCASQSPDASAQLRHPGLPEMSAAVVRGMTDHTAAGQAATMASGSEASAGEWVVFDIHAQPYALDVHAVREILRVPALERMPHAPSTLRGMANLRGAVVPVFDAAALLGLPDIDVTPLARVIVVEFDDDVLGLLVDRVLEIVRPQAAQMQPAPDVGGSQHAVIGLLRQPSRLVQCLGLAPLLG